MYTESQLNPQFLAKHHGNRQHDMTASRTPPSHREDSHENLRSPLGSCNAHATTLAEPSSMRWAATTQEDLRCRRAAPRRPSGAAGRRARGPQTAARRSCAPCARREAARAGPPKSRSPAPRRAKARRGAVPPRAFSARAARGAPRARPGSGGRRPVGGRRPIGAYRKAPSASATPCPPAAWRCSTLGEGGLNCRVRDGTGSIPASVVALAGGAPPRLRCIRACQVPSPGRPWRPHGGHGSKMRIALGALIEDAKSSGY